MDNQTILTKYFQEKMPEIVIDFNNIEEPKLIINLHFNKTLSKKRQLLEKNTEPYSNNILILYFYSLSRVNTLRQLKRQQIFLKNLWHLKVIITKKYLSEKFHSFQFFKYHSFKGHTAINYPFLFYGQNRTNLNKKSIKKF